MKEQDILKMRRDYLKEVWKEKAILSKSERYKELLNMPIIQEFLELQAQEEFMIDNNKVLDKLIPSVRRLDSNQIYVDMGTYAHTVDKIIEPFMVRPGSFLGNFKSYTDLETKETEGVAIKDTQAFENENLVISLPVSVYRPEEYGRLYSQLRYWFFNELLVRSQQEVVQSLMQPETLDKIFSSEGVLLNRKK